MLAERPQGLIERLKETWSLLLRRNTGMLACPSVRLDVWSQHRDAGLPLCQIRCLEPTQANSPTQAPLTKIHENPFKTAIESKRIKKNEEAEELVST